MIESVFSAALPRKSLVERVIAIALIAVLIFFIFLSCRIGISSVSEYLVNEHLDAWSKQQELPDQDSWNEVFGYYRFALRLTPQNPSLLQLGGKLYEWHYLLLKSDNTDQQQLEEAKSKSLKSYRSSLAIRPVWPYAWADFNAAKKRFDQIDEEFQKSFSRAFQYGRWDSDIQQRLVKTGMQSIAQLDSENRMRFLEMIQQLAEHKPKKLLSIAEKSGRLPLVCYGARGSKAIDRYCRKNGYK